MDGVDKKPKHQEVKEDGTVVKRSWRPHSPLSVPEQFKDSRFEYRWITDSMPGNILKKQYDGWELDQDIAPKMKAAGYLPPTTQDGMLKGNYLRVRDQILARMPKDLFNAKKEYYQAKSPKLADKLAGAKKDFTDTVSGVEGADTFGKIVIE